ncbi:MAG: hypothetical protein HN712_12910 [Gemmatimonadetes bacterium]|jgi:hypothetical protein|nr:hypothetical protein [Gemmatimonadota bacterium]
MRARHRYGTAVFLSLLALTGCLSLKYVALKGTSVPNPPAGRVKIAIGAFPVVSKASVVDPTASVSSPHDPSGGGGTRSAGLGGLAGESRDMEIARASRIEDLAGAVLRELRREHVRMFVYLEEIPDLEEVREFGNPFELVSAESGEAALVISGTALIRTRRISKQFTRETDSVEIGLTVIDVATGREVLKEDLRLGINLVFNSEELEEAMAVGVVTHLMQKTLF